MISSTGDLAPQAKKILVFRNGDPFHSGRRLVVNYRQFLTFEAFLTEVTSTIQASVAVRKLYTPRQGHRITELAELQSGHQYVAAGFESFKGLDYLHTGVKWTSGYRSKDSAQGGMATSHKLNMSAHWRKHIQMPCIIHVFRNGDLLSPPFRLLLSKRMLLEWDLVLGLLTEKASLRNGAVRKLCTLDGVPLSGSDELTHGEYYVAVGAERYKSLPYMELLVPKNSPHGALRNHPGNRRWSQKDGFNKPYSVSQDGASDSALISPHEQPDSRRVQSTGDANTEVQLSPPPAYRQPGKNQSTEDNSIFYAKPIRVRLNHKTSRDPPEADNQEAGRVFKVKESRQETAGAPEVVEDEHTRVELPLDQQAAETVEEEVTPRKKVVAHNQIPRAAKLQEPRESRVGPQGPLDPKGTRAGEKREPHETEAKAGKRRASQDMEEEGDQRAPSDANGRATHNTKGQAESRDTEEERTPRAANLQEPREYRDEPQGPPKDPKGTRAGEKRAPREFKAKGAGKRRVLQDMEEEGDQRAAPEADGRATHDAEGQAESRDAEEEEGKIPRAAKLQEPRESRDESQGPPKDPKGTRAGEKRAPRETKTKGAGKRRASQDMEEEGDQRATPEANGRATHDAKSQAESCDLEEEQEAEEGRVSAASGGSARS